MQAAAIASAIFDSVDPDEMERRREGLRLAFESFAGGTEMDGRAFAKLCKDTGLQSSKNLTTTDIDLIFAQSKDKDVRRIHIGQFRNALDAVARKKGLMRDDVIEIILASEGPKFKGTEASVSGSISAPLNSSSRRGSVTSTLSSASPKGSSMISMPTLRTTGSSKPLVAAELSREQQVLKDCYIRYSPYGEMDGKTFFKVAKDAKLVDKNFTSIDMDIIFASVKDKAARRINVLQFERGVRGVSVKTGHTFEAIASLIQETNGPIYEATVAEANRFSDRASDGHAPESPSLPYYMNGKVLGSATLAANQSASQQPRAPSIPAGLDAVFSNFAPAMEMDGATFLKVAKDAQLLDKMLTHVAIDLVFAKVIKKGERKISLDQFNEGLMEIAQRKGVDYDAVVQSVIAAGGPQFTGTKADKVKWYDDKSTFTGMHNSGEPVERSGRLPSDGSMKAERRLSTSTSSSVQDNIPALLVSSDKIESIESTFYAFAQTGEMDSRTFQKLLKDAGLVGKALTVTDIDLIFTKVKHISTKRLVFNQFIAALTEVASKVGSEHEAVAAAIIKVGGPQFVGTKADFVKFHDDKNFYTGMHSDETMKKTVPEADPSASWAPPAKDSQELRQIFGEYAPTGEMEGKTLAKIMRDANVLDKHLTPTEVDLVFAKVKQTRKAGDDGVRTVRKLDYKQFLQAVGECASRKVVSPRALVGMILDAGGPQFSGTVAQYNKFHDDKSTYTGMHAEDHETVEESRPVARRMIVSQDPASSLQEIFLRFSPAGEMDGKTFCKVAKDADIIGKSLSTIDIDIIFAKVKDKSARRISYNQFETGIHEFAHKMGTPFEKLAKILMDTGGPILQGTVAEANKYHDDKSLYTGMHGKPDALSATSQSSKPAQSTVIEVGYGPAESLEEVFELYSPNGDMDGRTFAKMARGAGLLDKNLAAPDVDLVFAKTRGKTTKIDFRKFQEGLSYLAERKKVDYDSLCDQIMDSGGPRLTGTQAEANKFYDRAM